MCSKKFTAMTFRFLHQVNSDTELPASDMKVAVGLTLFFNEKEDGRARAGCKKIGDKIGLSEATVIRSMHRLEARGHIRVVWGQQGRGHPNHVWMVVKKPAPVQVFDAAGKPASVQRKPAPVQENLLKNLGASKEAPKEEERESVELALDDPRVGEAAPGGAPPTEVEDHSTTSAASSAPHPRQQQEEHWRQLRALWDRGHLDDDRADRRAFDRACREVAPEVILAAARAWVAAYAAGQGVNFLKSLAVWLDRRGWERQPPASAKCKRAARVGARSNGKASGHKRDVGAMFAALGTKGHLFAEHAERVS